MSLNSLTDEVTLCHSLPRNETSREICKLIKHHCNSSEFRYTKYYYCAIPKSSTLTIILSFSAIVILVILLFIVLGILASNYLTPNLTTLSKSLHMNEKLSGLTLLAFANGAPDIFATYIAMNSGSTSLAIGELLGSANIALTVVFGSMMIVQPFKVDYRTFIRDVSLFTILIVISLLFLSDGKITFWESITMCLLYVGYIVLSFLVPEKLLDEDELLPTGTDNNDGDCDDDTRTIVSSDSESSNRDVNFERNVENLELGRSFRLTLVDSLKLAFKSWEARKLKHSSAGTSKFPEDEERLQGSSYQNDEVLENDHKVVYGKKFIPTISVERVDEPTPASPSPITSIPSIVINSDCSTSGETRPLLSINTSSQFLQAGGLYSSPAGSTDNLSVRSTSSSSSQILSTIGSSVTMHHAVGSSIVIHHTVQAPQLVDKIVPELTFTMEAPLETIFCLITLPINVIFNLIVPTPPNEDYLILPEDSPSAEETLTEWEDEEYTQRIILFNIQLFLSCFIVFRSCSLKIILLSLTLLCLNIILDRTAPKFYRSKFKFFSCLVGFIATLNLITISASELINILQNIGIIYHIPESILGMTILSIGNSIGDLITNVTLASLGLALTGLHACFGSPLLYVVFGIGLNSTIYCIKENVDGVVFEVDYNLKFASYSVLFILLIYLIVVPLNNWYVGRKFGTFCVLFWSVCMCIQIYWM